ncbi:hypothetical protein ACQEVI_03545 [Promicromonospora sp. CA-289599]|uniref:hypothetical protein n=1 Tax=Promicromonospora sp. CA-289599 TaxID=3240014 RepID=UPI003D8C5EDE
MSSMVPDRALRGPARGLVTVALALVATSLLVACAPAAARSDDVNALGSVCDHLDESSSAVATARLAVQARASGRLPGVTADVSIADAAETATGAVHGIGTLVLSDADADRVRDEALDAASGAVGPVTAARTWLGRPPSAAQDVLRALDDAGNALDRAKTAVERARSAAVTP